MAEVLSPLSSPNDPASYIHARPSSSDKYQTAMSSSQQQQQQHQQQQPRFNTLPRSQYPSQQTPTGYRGASAAPIAPYAFKSTPQLRNDSKTDVNTRKSSAPPTFSPLQPLSSENPSAANRQRYPAPSSISTTSSGSSTNPPSLPPFSKDDSSLFTSFTVPDFSISSDVNGASSPLATDKDANSSFLVDPSKPSPERYRRGHRRAETNVPAQPPQVYQPPGNINVSNGFDTGKMGQFFYNPQKSVSPQRKPVPPPATEAKPIESTVSNEEVPMKNSPLNNEKPDFPKRYRKRTGTSGSVDTQTPPDSPSAAVHSPKEPASPVQASSRQEIRPSSSGSAHRHSSSSSRNEPQGTRSFTSADAVRRMQNPSPLSKPPSSGDPASISDPSSAGPSSSPKPSPAVAAMAALNVGEKDPGKGVKSRIRRAFSFGSAQELKRASGGSGANDADPTAADKAKARQEQFSNELDEEQDAIAKQQEAAGLGNSIYSGQGNVFTGSTDNLSISSTASSASLMLRKMGKGMKKGGRSIKGLFRPKSVIGVPAADGPSEPSVGQVSMVTVEAEREKVNVNVDPHAQAGGGTGFPKLERNSMDTGRVNLSTDLSNGDPNDTTSKDSRRSIIGGDQDRQEVLAAVKRGILKRTGTSSPVTSPLSHPGEVDSPSPTVFAGAGIERKGSPVPSTTSSEPRRNGGHRRTDSHTLEGDDYFARGGQGNHSSKSLPGTPRGGARNISFSPRIQFYDVWSSSEYDRRGDIATCNRLTPMLAQQIKEELNNFKMEMEVHELSKPHTHFF